MLVVFKRIIRNTLDGFESPADTAFIYGKDKSFTFS